MSLIHVQAGVALHLVDRKPEQVETALETIKDASKEALNELRALIGVLRADGEKAPRAPIARLEALNELADRASHAGVTTTVARSGDVDEAVEQGGNGLLGMRERASALGGSVELADAPGGGARLHATLPLGGVS